MVNLKQTAYYKIFSVIFSAAVVGLAALNIFIPDKEYSSQEKRVLSSLPEINISGIMDGSFMEQFDDYETDQFAGRNTWMSIKIGMEKLTGKNMSQDVYSCRDSYFCERFYEPDMELLEKTCQEICGLAESYPDAAYWFLLVPNNISINENLLPAFAITADQNEYIDLFYDKIDDKVTTLDIRDMLNEKKSEVQLFYRTDHHWTSDAAYETYFSVADAMGLKTESYKSGIAVTSFNGSLTAKSGFSAKKLDKINVYIPDNPVHYVVTYVEEQKRTVTCYQTEYIDSDDPYMLFFGGNHSQINIDTDADSDRSLLIMKDSYANCFIPFLLSDFKQITVIDPRYYYGSLDQLMRQNEYTDVLYLYNVNTLSQDNNLYAVLENRQ